VGGDPIPGLHVVLREWFEAFKSMSMPIPEIEIKPKEKVKPNYLHGTGGLRGKW